MVGDHVSDSNDWNYRHPFLEASHELHIHGIHGLVGFQEIKAHVNSFVVMVSVAGGTVPGLILPKINNE